MQDGYRVAVVGVTGAVGQEILSILETRSFPVRELIPVASERSRGKTVFFRGKEITIQPVKPGLFAGVDLVLASAGSFVTAQIAQEVVDAGAVLIDNSSQFRMEPEVPLVVPEVNAHALAGHRNIIANPNCNAAILSPVLGPLHREFGIERLFVATYQAASGAGHRAMVELQEESAAVLAGRPHENSVIPYQYAFNVFLHNTELMDNGYVTEEWKVISELRKILDEPALPVNVHSVRVPVMRSHAEVVNVELAGTPSVEELYTLLGAAPGVAVYGTDGWDEHGLGPTPVGAAHTDDVLVGRVRRDHTADNRYDIWLTGDQLRKGAALNAVQIAETLLPVSACCV
ncbi:MAG: aspartate-semialdehyde dehydrogenase [Spirochaeta sp.]|jgi:aspartate-semialdehyde dehydrogenase|nr:aspartate-semialdehyde dehydrogenase [Spirochaeta sp.]